MYRLALCVLSSVVGLLLSATIGAAQTLITECGRSWSGDLVLVGDLDCSATPDPAITLEDDAKLELAGFTLTGGASTGVSCRRDCTIAGGSGAITGAALAGVRAPFADLLISDLDISDNGESGISAWPKGRVTATNLTLNDNGGDGIEARFTTATGCAANNNRRSGFYGDKRVTVTDSTATGNRRGIYGHRRILVNDSVVTNNEVTGVYAYKRVEINGSTITGNTGSGAWSGRGLRVSSSTFADNDTHSSCNVPMGWPCADLVSHRSPRLASVTCETSARLTNRDGFIGNWGVCAED